MTDEQLLPCPFCGGKAYIGNGPPHLFYVECSRPAGCGISGLICNAPDEAVAAWNTRALLNCWMDSERLIKERDALRARVAELEALLTQALPHIQHASSAMYYGQSDGYRVREHAHDLLHVIDAAMGKSL